MSTSDTSEGAGASPFEPDVPGPDADPGSGQPIADPDLRKTGEALRDRLEIRSLAITGLFVLAFIAVPLLATFKIFCDHIEALAPIGEFLGR
jgi:hypothetical protein